jgi:CDP-diacylglycerol--glycerol-3-phosphate 3-phosphatidyltransferase
MTLPNQLTILRILLTPVFIILLFSQNHLFKYISLLIFLIATLTDWYDGYFARKYGYVTTWGKFLDPLADKILISSTLYALYYLGKVDLWMVNLIVLRDFLITGLRSYAQWRRQPVVTSYTAKIKTFVQMTVVYVILFLYLLEIYASAPGVITNILNFLVQIQFIYYLMLFITLLTVYTMIQYFIVNKKHLKQMFWDLLKLLGWRRGVQ